MSDLQALSDPVSHGGPNGDQPDDPWSPPGNPDPDSPDPWVPNPNPRRSRTVMTEMTMTPRGNEDVLAALTRVTAERDDPRDLLRTIRDAIDGGVRAKAIYSAVAAVLDDSVTEVEATLILRRMARSKNGRRSA